jgi:hypothetical protein
MVVSLKSKQIITSMTCIIALLSCMHIAQLCTYFYIGDPDVFDFIEAVDFDYEANLPSLYSSLAILLCATLLWLIWLYKKSEKLPFRHHWLGLAMIFTFLGADEAIAIHEELGDFIESLALFEAKGVLYFAWVVPYGLLLAIFAASYLKFVLALPKETMVQFILAGSIFITGAIGIEIISATEADMNGTETIKYSVLYTLEELCEMLGIVLFCRGLLHYIKAEISEFTVRII